MSYQAQSVRYKKFVSLRGVLATRQAGGAGVSVAHWRFAALLWSLLGISVAPAGMAQDNLPEKFGALHSAISDESRAGYCLPYDESELYTKRSNSVTLGPEDNWVDAIRKASPDTEFLLRDGTYKLDHYALVVGSGITIRSLSGNRNSVTLAGRGYQEPAEGLMLGGDDITIADLSITAMRDHAISVKPGMGARQQTRIYNVHLYDIGTQHVKVSAGGTIDGLVACSSIGYTADGVAGDYIGGIDLHESENWLVRDNTLYNIRGDGTGCNVDTDCGRYISGPAVLVWNNSKNTVVTRNLFYDNYRNIAFGLGRGHEGGVISDNLVVQDSPGDAGIELQTASGTRVESNTVVLAGYYRGAIEYRDSSELKILSNTLTRAPHDRGGNKDITLRDNVVDRDLADSL